MRAVRDPNGGTGYCNCLSIVRSRFRFQADFQGHEEREDEQEVVDDGEEAEEEMVCQPVERIIDIFNIDRHGDWQTWADTCGDAGAEDEKSCKEVNERCEWVVQFQYDEVDEAELERIEDAKEDCMAFYNEDVTRLSRKNGLCRSGGDMHHNCEDRLEEQLNRCRNDLSLYRRFMDGGEPHCGTRWAKWSKHYGGMPTAGERWCTNLMPRDAVENEWVPDHTSCVASPYCD